MLQILTIIVAFVLAAMFIPPQAAAVICLGLAMVYLVAFLGGWGRA